MRIGTAAITVLVTLLASSSFTASRADAAGDPIAINLGTMPTDPNR